MRNRNARIILWTDTVVDGVHGVNDREILQEALKPSQLRYESTLTTGRHIKLATACSKCRRHRGAQWCADCKKWHYPNCLPGCNASRNATASSAQQHYLRYTWQPGSDEVTIQAGDGSVMQANTAAAHGGWGIQTVGGLLVLINFTFNAKISPPHVAKSMVYMQECPTKNMSTRKTFSDDGRGRYLHQSQKPPSRHPMTIDEVPMTNTEEWTGALRQILLGSSYE
ncbi:hypothetical protein PHMEG_00011459 [Phytophthora megakarya]|uniref:Uncharacterized protein n=1 Tax=Phytophthora megakarya TaxID=4795 RepID=A0A225WB68_9STRA|nr:hypothetical protein PHMEG_00011459 [Phytophthora megakarya]